MKQIGGMRIRLSDMPFSPPMPAMGQRGHTTKTSCQVVFSPSQPITSSITSETFLKGPDTVRRELEWLTY